MMSAILETLFQEIAQVLHSRALEDGPLIELTLIEMWHVVDTSEAKLNRCSRRHEDGSSLYLGIHLTVRCIPTHDIVATDICTEVIAS